ncbi:MAG: hypothetical protein M1482_06090 [Chloroflexi bacterium]|nr:hypothetical protein [Chloroflexota bacterium]
MERALDNRAGRLVLADRNPVGRLLAERLGLPVSQRAFIMNLAPQGIADQIRVARRLGDLTQREEIDVLRRALAAPGVNRLAQTQKVGTEAGRVDQFERPLDMRETFHIRIHGPRVVGGAQIAFGRARGLAAAIPMQRERACEFIACGAELFHDPRHAPMPPRARPGLHRTARPPPPRPGTVSWRRTFARAFVSVSSGQSVNANVSRFTG